MGLFRACKCGAATTEIAISSRSRNFRKSAVQHGYETSRQHAGMQHCANNAPKTPAVESLEAGLAAEKAANTKPAG